MTQGKKKADITSSGDNSKTSETSSEKETEKSTIDSPPIEETEKEELVVEQTQEEATSEVAVTVLDAVEEAVGEVVIESGIETQPEEVVVSTVSEVSEQIPPRESIVVETVSNTPEEHSEVLFENKKEEIAQPTLIAPESKTVTPIRFQSPVTNADKVFPHSQSSHKEVSEQNIGADVKLENTLDTQTDTVELKEQTRIEKVVSILKQAMPLELVRKALSAVKDKLKGHVQETTKDGVLGIEHATAQSGASESLEGNKNGAFLEGRRAIDTIGEISAEYPRSEVVLLDNASLDTPPIAIFSAKESALDFREQKTVVVEAVQQGETIVFGTPGKSENNTKQPLSLETLRPLSTVEGLAQVLDVILRLNKLQMAQDSTMGERLREKKQVASKGATLSAEAVSQEIKSAEISILVSEELMTFIENGKEIAKTLQLPRRKKETAQQLIKISSAQKEMLIEVTTLHKLLKLHKMRQQISTVAAFQEQEIALEELGLHTMTPNWDKIVAFWFVYHVFIFLLTLDEERQFLLDDFATFRSSKVGVLHA